MTRSALLLALLLATLPWQSSQQPRSPPSVAAARRAFAASPHRTTQTAAKPDLSSCTTSFLSVPLDHFSFPAEALGSLPLRVVVCSAFWKPASDGRPGPVLLYTGNEADVSLYVEHTGLMWESAPELGALLVFAEHRFYGQSQPEPDALSTRRFLSSEQALADFALLVQHLREHCGCAGAPVIALGGSYGGMLAAWLRIHYPAAVDGAVAASAPILAFDSLTPAVDAGGFAAGVTLNMDSVCAANLRAAWPALAAAAEDDLQALNDAFRLCPESALRDTSDALALAYWLQSAFDYLAMGNFPYASDYLTNGGAALPAWPVKAACVPLSDPSLSSRPTALLAALRDAAAVFYNASGDAACFATAGSVNDDTALDGFLWGFQACTEMVMPMSRDGLRDAFFSQPWDAAAYAAGCNATYGVTPRPGWAAASYGGTALRSASNIVFTNGALDPWRYGGVLQAPSPTLTALTMDSAAHHLDLMFAHPDDPASVVQARSMQRAAMRRFIAEAYAGRPPGGAANPPAEHSGLLPMHAALLGGLGGALLTGGAVLAQRGWQRRRVRAAEAVLSAPLLCPEAGDGELVVSFE